MDADQGTLRALVTSLASHVHQAWGVGVVGSSGSLIIF